MVLKICLYISQYLVCFSYKETRELIILLVENQKIYIVLLSLQHTHFLHSKKFFAYKIGISFDKDPLVVEQNNYATKIVNPYTADKLDT